MSVDAGTLGRRSTQRLFALRVKGDSMIDRHILPGDVVVLEHGREPRPSDTVAALIDGESTLKVLVQQRGRAFLRAANGSYPDLLLPVNELAIQGVLVAVIRRLAMSGLYMNASAEMLASKPIAAPVDRQRPAPPVTKAQHYAAKITEWIAPHCQQVEPVSRHVQRRLLTPY